MVGGEPDTLGQERTLPAKKLITMIEPVQRVFGVIEDEEVQLAEARDAEMILETAALWGQGWHFCYLGRV